jgi:Domain of unknown function (DUF4136)
MLFGKLNPEPAHHFRSDNQILKQETLMETLMKSNSRRFAFATITLTVLVLASPYALNAQKVETDYDKTKNFSEYHTYYWAKVDGPNPLMNQRVQDAIDAELQKKGWSKQEGSGQVAVAALGTTQTKKDLQTFYSGSPWGWGGFGGGTSTTSVSEYKEGTLVVDMYDSNSHQLLWRSTASDTVSDKPEKNEKKLDKAVEKMFEKFPPQPK